jgi:hypothetical protein
MLEQVREASTRARKKVVDAEYFVPLRQQQLTEV